MIIAALISLGVVFLAELGDKSQLITMAYALRHRWWLVLTGVGIAAFGVHGISVVAGHFLGMTLPERPIAAVAGLAFICFAVWTWRETANAPGGVPTVHEPRFVLSAVVPSVVLAELGDKTMLATVALASDHNWAGVWAGATAGMVLADAVAIAVATLLHRRLPEHFLHGAASLLFLGFGLWILFDDALGWRAAAITATAAVGSAGIAATLLHWLPARRAGHRAASGSGTGSKVG
ncbi:MAG TPA: TMEM165/GDT1 family protein [Mycobacterium sp.]|nr:TMEM165/GDT1 family protein [Mycobacterium sp.]